MDLWTPEVQNALMGLLQAVFSIIAAWIGVEAARYVAALKAKALQAAAETGNALLEQAAETAVRYVEQVASQQVAKWTGKQKLHLAADYVTRQMPGVSIEDAEAAIEAVLNRLKSGYGSITPQADTATRVATTITQATVEDVAERAADVIARAEKAARNLQAITEGLKADGGGDQ